MANPCLPQDGDRAHIDICMLATASTDYWTAGRLREWIMSHRSSSTIWMGSFVARMIECSWLTLWTNHKWLSAGVSFCSCPKDLCCHPSGHSKSDFLFMIKVASGIGDCFDTVSRASMTTLYLKRPHHKCVSSLQVWYTFWSLTSHTGQVLGLLFLAASILRIQLLPPRISWAPCFLVSELVKNLVRRAIGKSSPFYLQEGSYKVSARVLSASSRYALS